MQVKFDMLSYHSCSIIISRVLFATACSILRICVYIHTHHTQYIYIYISIYLSIYLPIYLSIYLSKEVGKQYFRATNDFYLMELTMMKGGT